MKSEYEHRRDGHIELTDALVSIDEAASQYCAGSDSCTEEDCVERGFHVDPPSDEFFQELEAARQIVKGALVTTLASMLRSDPITILDERP